MNPLLQSKFDELNDSNKFECWYLVKQTTDFDVLCYLVSFLDEYQHVNTNQSLEQFINDSFIKLNGHGIIVSTLPNYRALRVAAFFGLIEMHGNSSYVQSIISPTYYEIKKRCGGNFENTYLYADIIERQIEKVFISSEIDEQNESVRKGFRLYPVMFLYKVLLELGLTTKRYSISIDEYRYLVATSKRYEDLLNTLLLIILYRQSENADAVFRGFKPKFDNRFNQALRQLPTLTVSNDEISIKDDKINEVAEKVFLFEKNHDFDAPDNYISFLGSTDSLTDIDSGFIALEDIYKAEYCSEGGDQKRLETGSNILLYGVPGSGKSWTIQHEYCNSSSVVERLVFHPDYTYSDFVGQILPNVSEEGHVTYRFSPGPFTRALRDAYSDPSHEYIIIIEEINRGNAPAIFGDVFQLLDRVKTRDKNNSSVLIGESQYGITNSDMARVIYADSNHKVKIPSNLSIIATMNTSDQNVFTLDTAFQRRWDMRLIENTFDHVDPSFANTKILDTGVTWKRFCTVINQAYIEDSVNITSSEDKRLGAYFVQVEDILYNENMINYSTADYNSLLYPFSSIENLLIF